MWFKKKNKEEKILSEMKQKKEQIEKLKEDMNKMAKLVLKDGRLQKVEEKKDVEKVEEELTVPMPPPPIKQVPNFIKPVPSFEELTQNRVAEEQYKRQIQEQMIREQMNNDILQEQQRRAYEQQVAQTMNTMNDRQQMSYQPQGQPNLIKISIEMINGVVYGVEIPEEFINKFLTDLDTAINSQTIFPLNNRIVNGRNIVSYNIVE